MKRLALLTIPAALFGLCACNNDGPIELSLSQDSVPADGRDTIIFEATINQGGSPVKDGTKVRFAIENADAGTFTQGKSVLFKDGKTSAGHASVEFYPGTTPIEDVIVTASATVNKVVQTDSKTLAITDPTPVSAYYFSFTCNYESVGAYTDAANQVKPEIQVPCTVVTKDRDGRDLPNAKVEFHAEAGEIKTVPATSKAPRSFYYTYKPGSIKPANVAPSESEKELGLISPECNNNVDDPNCKNPRDSLVTIVAIVDNGEEYCEKITASGKCDMNATFWDEGEPFLDIDDDGLFSDEMQTNEPSQKWWADTNNDGKCNEGNGVWDQRTTLGRFTRILLTGDPATANTGITSSDNSLSMCACDKRSFKIRVMDEYFNAPSTCVSTDKLTITPFSNSQLNNEGQGALDLANTINMNFGTEYSFRDVAMEGTFKSIRTGENKSLIGREWSYTMTDTQSGCSYDDGPDYSDCTTDSSGKAKTCKEVKTGSMGDLKAKYVYTPVPKVSGVTNIKTETKEYTFNGFSIKDFKNSACAPAEE